MVQCAKCRKPHHQSLCDEGSNPVSPTDQSGITAVGKVDVGNPAFTYLQTAKVRIPGLTGLSKHTRCVLDGGNRSSFITDTLIEDLKLGTTEHRELNVSAFESQSPPPNQRRLLRFNITGFGQIALFRSAPLRARTRFRRSQLSRRKSETYHVPVKYGWPIPRQIY